MRHGAKQRAEGRGKQSLAHPASQRRSRVDSAVANPRSHRVHRVGELQLLPSARWLGRRTSSPNGALAVRRSEEAGLSSVARRAALEEMAGSKLRSHSGPRVAGATSARAALKDAARFYLPRSTNYQTERFTHHLMRRHLALCWEHRARRCAWLADAGKHRTAGGTFSQTWDRHAEHSWGSGGNTSRDCACLRLASS